MGDRYDVFLSYSSADRAWVEELARRLQRENIKPWFDKWNLIPGESWMPALEAALGDCSSCAVMIGAGNVGSWQQEEMRMAIDRRVRDQHGAFRVIPVLMPGLERPERSRLPGFLVAANWVEFRNSLDDAHAFHQLVCGIRGIEPGPGPDGAVFKGQNPYRGLELFDVEHAPIFFGREATTEWLLDALKRKPSGDQNRFLAIVGASGSGKSSLARAGLLASLKKGGLEGSAAWPRAITRPGAEPLAGLAKAMVDLTPQKLADIVYRGILNCKDHERSLHLATNLILDESERNSRVVLLVDQFEEVFTLCNNENERRGFIDNLLYASTVTNGRTMVVLSMRADFYHRCAAYVGLAAAMSDHQLLVSPMSNDELRKAIDRPARLAGLEPESGLVELLIDEVRGRPGALPLLQFALQEMWRRQDSHRLTIQAYREIGGIEGALQRKADAVYAGFTPAQRELCRRIFLRLVHPGEGTEDTRRRASIREVLPDDPAQSALVEGIIGRLTDHETRLLTTERKQTALGEGTLEVAHEALIRSWPELRKWIDADRAGLRTHRQLTEAAQQWQEQADDPAYLYSGSRLDVAREWAASRRGELNPLERRFLAQSLHLRREHEAEKQAAARKLAEESEARRVAETRRAQEAEEANKRLREQLYDNHIAVAERELTMNQDIGRADTLLQECPEEFRGWEWFYLMRLRDGGRASTKAHVSALWGAEFSPDGKNYATVSVDGMLKIWETETGQIRPNGEINAGEIHQLSQLLNIPILGPFLRGRLVRAGKIRLPITCFDFSPDGRVIATGSFAPPIKVRVKTQDLRKSPALIRVWDFLSGCMVAEFQGPEQLGVMLAITFSPDSRRIVSSSIDPRNNFVVRDSTTGEVIKVVTGHTSQIHRLRYSFDGRILASAETNGIVKLWDAHTFEELLSISAHPAPVVGISFEPPNAARFATAGNDGKIRIWETVTGHEVFSLEGHTGATLDVRYSPDGKRIASAGFDKTVRVWDSATGKEKITLRGHEDTVWSVAFSPDGGRLISGAFDKTARIWDSTPLEEQKKSGIFIVSGPGDHRVNSVAFSPDGRYLASGGWDTEVRLMDGSTGELVRTFQGHRLVIFGIAFSPDGRRIASASWDHSVKVWDVETGREILTFKGHTAPVQSVSFSPDGSRIASGGFDGHLKVWDTYTGHIHAHCDGFVFPVTAVAYSPDGNYVASGGTDRVIKLWDICRATTVLVWKGHEASIYGLNFSPDGRSLASASWDGTLRLWNVDLKRRHVTKNAGKPIFVKKHDDRVNDVAFSRDGQYVASACEDKTVRVWNIRSHAEVMKPCRHRGIVWSVAFSPDGNRIAAGTWANADWVRTWSTQ